MQLCFAASRAIRMYNVLAFGQEVLYCNSML